MPAMWGVAAFWRVPSVLASVHENRHTEGVGIMDLDTWVSLGALLSVGAALGGYIRASMRDLKNELKDDINTAKANIEKLDTKIGKLDTKIDEARKEAKNDNAAARNEAKADNQRLREEVTAQIGTLREHVDHGFARIDGRLDVLEQRTYDIKPTGT